MPAPFVRMVLHQRGTVIVMSARFIDLASITIMVTLGLCYIFMYGLSEIIIFYRILISN